MGLAVGTQGRAADNTALGEHAEGERAEADVVTPIPLVVFNPERTERLREAEARAVPPVFRVVPSALERAEELLRGAFAARQSEFTSSLQTAFGHPVPLLTVEVRSPRFAEPVKAFRQRRPDFPLSPELTELWAFGDSGDVVLNGLLGRVRRLTNGYVRADALPAGESLSGPNIRLVPAETLVWPLTLAAVDGLGQTVSSSALLTLGKVRLDALRGVPAGEREVIQFVAGFLGPDCFFDEELTRKARARATGKISATDRYAAGQVIVREGEPITAQVKLALNELRARAASDQAQAAAAAEHLARARVEAELTVVRQPTDISWRTDRRLLGGLVAAGILGGMLVGLRWRRRLAARRFRGRSSIHSAPDSGFTLVPAGEPELDAGAWRERALAAEATAQKATALLRGNLLAHMSRWMMNEMVQRLLSQRSVILTSQEKAEKEVAELALRLDQLHAPLEERLRAYEKRIAELEAELAAKGKQNAELIKAKIETTRKHLEGERSEDRLNWN